MAIVWQEHDQDVYERLGVAGRAEVEASHGNAPGARLFLALAIQYERARVTIYWSTLCVNSNTIDVFEISCTYVVYIFVWLGDRRFVPMKGFHLRSADGNISNREVTTTPIVMLLCMPVYSYLDN